MIKKYIENFWDTIILPTLCEYITIPCKSPQFDANWEENGYIDAAMKLLSDWCLVQAVKNMQLTVHRLPGRTPVLVLDIAGQSSETILLYGHMDKQPEMTGWRADLGPWRPVIDNERLYGRGGADDGYAVFSCLAAIKALQEQNLPHARCVVLIEASEESGSCDLPFYIAHLFKQIGTPSLIICLDSGAGNYQQLWNTTSLRGLISGVLSVDILTAGVHSGEAGGVIPSSFRLIRQLLSRLEDERTGTILLDELFVAIPPDRNHEAAAVAKELGKDIWQKYSWVKGAAPAAMSAHELLLNCTWRPALAITGVEGIPALENAGNVLRPRTALMLSLRIPPTCDVKQAVKIVKDVLERDSPHNAQVNFEVKKASAGWTAPPLADWLATAVNTASEQYFGRGALNWGEGGSIPFMQMLGEKFPDTQFLITGVLGPHSNAHGPNEFLDIPTVKKVTCVVADIIHAHFLAH